MAYTAFPTSRRPHSSTEQPKIPLRFDHPDLNLNLITSPSIKTRLQHFLLPLVAFFELPFVTFLDYNLLYAFFNLSSHALPTTNDRVWYLAFAAYLLLSMASYGLLLLRLCNYFQHWASQPSILSTYCNRSSYVFTSIFRGYEYFCFLSLVSAAASLQDRIREHAHWHLQDWPNVLLLLLRAVIIVALLLTHHVFDSNQTTPNTAFDSSYYTRDASITEFLLAVCFIQLTYTALRLILLYIAFIISNIGSKQQYQCLLPKTPDLEDSPDLYAAKDWRTRAEARIQQVVDFYTSPKSSRRMSGAPLLPEIPLDTNPLYVRSPRSSSAREMVEVSRPALERIDSDDSATTPVAGELGRFSEQFYDERQSGETISDDQRLSTLMEEDEEGTNTWRWSTVGGGSPRVSNDAARRLSVDQALPSPLLSSAMSSSRSSSEQQKNEQLPPARRRPQSSDTFGIGRRVSEDNSE